MLLFKFMSYVFVAYGLTEILVYSNGPAHIFEKLRALAKKIHPYLGELLECSLCTSTWVGFLLSCINVIFIPSIYFTPFNIILGSTGYGVLIVILDMLFTSGVVWLLSKIEDYYSLQTEMIIEEAKKSLDEGNTEERL